MFEKILVLTDFSAYAQKFLEYIGDLPEVKDVTILNVVSKNPEAETWDPVAEVKEAERKLARDKKIVKVPDINVKVRAVSVEGIDIATEIPKAIQKVASEENVRLVVMGARGKSSTQSIFLGSMTKGFFRYGDKHLLIMRYKMRDGSGSEALEKFGDKILSKVLVPTDFSKPAEVIFSAVRNMLGVGEIVLLHAVSRGASKEEIEANVNKAEEKLSSIIQEFGKDGMKITPRVAIGFSTDVICSVAEEEDVSMIAMSSAGENALREERIGNVTYGVVDTAHRPVLIIKLKKVYNYVY